MISVILPVYNVEDYLHVCINSVLNQTFQDFEIICINDASTDSSLEILQYFVKKDPRVKLISNETNIGLGPSRNKGIDVAVGKYIIFLDSDDWYSSDSFEILFNEAEKYNLDFAIAKTIVYYEDEGKFGMENHYDMKGLLKYEGKVFNHWELEKSDLLNIPIAAWNKLFLKSFLDDNNIRFPKENLIHEDNPFSYKAIICAEKILFINKYLYIRRRRQGSLMTLKNDRLFDVIYIVYLVLEVFLDDAKIYTKYKQEVLELIFKILLTSRYNQIEKQYKDEFFIEVQKVFKTFIAEYGLYEDIKNYVDKNILNLFKFDVIAKDVKENK